MGEMSRRNVQKQIGKCLPAYGRIAANREPSATESFWRESDLWIELNQVPFQSWPLPNNAKCLSVPSEANFIVADTRAYRECAF